MPWNGSDPSRLGVYLHVPFCSVRCRYCDFPTVAGRDSLVGRYLDALEAEIERGQPGLPLRANTVYLGGGTPSRLSPEEVRRLLAAVRRRFDLSPSAEITIEGNPDTLDAERLAGYREAGINRLSVGVQSLDDRVLASVRRPHSGREGLEAIRRAREAGFEAVNADLIAGLPGERLDGWADTLRRVVSCGPDHVSVYLLETDKDTPLARSIRSGRTAPFDEEELARAYETTIEVLTGEGFELYEISNFCRPGFACRHNLKYWTDAPYAGFGLGACGYVGGERRRNRRDLEGYLETIFRGGDPAEWVEPYEPERRLEEALFLGLRIVQGVDLDRLANRYGIDPGSRYAELWERAERDGLLVREGSRLRLTPFGRLHSNSLFAELV